MCSLLRKKYQKSKSKKKKIGQKIKEKIVKENRRYRKGAHKEHSIALLFVVSFALFISVATFNTCFLSSLFLSCLSQLVIETRIGQQLGQVLWTFIQYCCLSLTCVPHIHICSFACLPSSTYTSDRYRKRPLQSWCHTLTGITYQPPVVPSTALRW